LLWAQGNAEAAIQMEQFGNQLTKLYPVDTLCGYSVGSIQGGWTVTSSNESVQNTQLFMKLASSRIRRVRQTPVM
jgi:hypothetical protein